ncbi:MAG TPA: OmpA family protein, partial [Myxococcaceae bacterium]|nr:OmpA family protein [Myxococcaceae bacterium]
TLRQIHFAPGKATILGDSFSLLAEIVDAIVKAGIRAIRIEGHTDNRGERKKNLLLSEQRAKAVATYLGRAGIYPGRLEAVGFGDSRPIAPNLTARGRELNRRVELIIVER